MDRHSPLISPPAHGSPRGLMQEIHFRFDYVKDERTDIKCWSGKCALFTGYVVRDGRAGNLKFKFTFYTIFMHVVRWH